jgi:hypothetical protein
MSIRAGFRLGPLAWVLLVLLAGCVTGSSMEGRAVAELRPDNGEAVFGTLPTDFEPVRLQETEVMSALTQLMLEIPLRVASSPAPSSPGLRLAPGAGGSGGEAWQSALSQDYGRFCERRGTPGDCLNMLKDVPLFQADDKRDLALALAVGPALEGVSAEVQAMVSTPQLVATVSLTITASLALLVAPEPVSKGVAAAFGLFLWGYLGWEFFDVIRAYVQLSEDSARATTFTELREAGERFGQVIGPNSVRILVILGTASLGETAALMSRAPKLPGFARASRTVEVNTGLTLPEAVAATERVIVSVPEGNIRVVLPPQAMAMAAQNLPHGHRAWRSHRSLTRALGPAGEGKEWHHIVEQTAGNVKRFGPEAIHNTENVIPIDAGIHDKISAAYSTKLPNTNKTVRQWLSEQSYEAQREYGRRMLRRYGIEP